ncbi:Hin recombinase [Nitrobacter sp. TKz-YC01]
MTMGRTLYTHLRLTGARRVPRRHRSFSKEQIAFVLKQAEDGAAVADVCRKAGISEATVYNWRTECAGLMPSEMKRLGLLTPENSSAGWPRFGERSKP